MLPFFERWMRIFPDFETLAAASPETVLKEWEGLGYYNRARNLHKLAKTYIALPREPRTAGEWRALPGVGPYTAAAISSIAYNEPAAVVDGNVVRILARVNNDTRVFSGNAEAVRAFRETADALLDPQNPGRHNQALMELGATVCHKRKPLCTICPIIRFCKAAARGQAEALPRLRRRATEHVEIHRLWIQHKGRLLLHRAPETASQLSGQYELPAAEDLGQSAPATPPIAVRKRSITYRRIRESIFHLNLTPSLEHRIAGKENLQWIPMEQIESITLSGPHRRWIRELRESGG